MGGRRFQQWVGCILCPLKKSSNFSSVIGSRQILYLAFLFEQSYMPPEWICIILFYGWSSYVISSGLRQYLDFAPYIIERVSKYLGWRGNTFFSQTCDFCPRMICLLYEFVCRRRIRFRSFLLCPSIVWSVAPTVTCDSWPLRIIFKLPLSEAENSFKADTSYSLISALFSLRPALIIFLFHPIHRKQFATIEIVSYPFSRLISSSPDIIVSHIILFRIYEFIFWHRHWVLPIRTPEFV